MAISLQLPPSLFLLQLCAIIWPANPHDPIKSLHMLPISFKKQAKGGQKVLRMSIDS